MRLYVVLSLYFDQLGELRSFTNLDLYEKNIYKNPSQLNYSNWAMRHMTSPLITKHLSSSGVRLDPSQKRSPSARAMPFSWATHPRQGTRTTRVPQYKPLSMEKNCTSWYHTIKQIISHYVCFKHFWALTGETVDASEIWQLHKIWSRISLCYKSFILYTYIYLA